tara:strand:+ start:7777 stop:8379 length:603 start_codon:yes stop_codon:yes gene_type:complete
MRGKRAFLGLLFALWASAASAQFAEDERHIVSDLVSGMGSASNMEEMKAVLLRDLDVASLAESAIREGLGDKAGTVDPGQVSRFSGAVLRYLSWQALYVMDGGNSKTRISAGQRGRDIAAVFLSSAEGLNSRSGTQVVFRFGSDKRTGAPKVHDLNVAGVWISATLAEAVSQIMAMEGADLDLVSEGFEQSASQSWERNP